MSPNCFLDSFITFLMPENIHQVCRSIIIRTTVFGDPSVGLRPSSATPLLGPWEGHTEPVSPSMTWRSRTGLEGGFEGTDQAWHRLV